MALGRASWTFSGVAALLATLAVAATGAVAASVEYAVKATFLYKFGPFVEWPAEAFSSPDAPLSLCVVGEDPFGSTLDEAVAGQTIAERPIHVRRLARVEGDAGCHIMYLAGSPGQSVAAALDAVRGRHVLTVTDGAVDQGSKGIIHFVVRDNRVRFEIDNQAATASGIALSSKLLNLAVAVRRRT